MSGVVSIRRGKGHVNGGLAALLVGRQQNKRRTAVEGPGGDLLCASVGRNSNWAQINNLHNIVPICSGILFANFSRIFAPSVNNEVPGKFPSVYALFQINGDRQFLLA
jgi:hypothetical protein